MTYTKEELKTMIRAETLPRHLRELYQECKGYVSAHRIEILKSHKNELRKKQHIV